MSGSFYKGVNLPFIDKWTKAKMAIDNGVDLVFELPFYLFQPKVQNCLPMAV